MKCVLIIMLLAAAGCGDEGGSGELQGPTGANECRAPTILYLNRNGGVVTSGGQANAVADTVPLNIGSVVIEPWTVDEKQWAGTVACVEYSLAPYNIEIVQSDPGDLDHHEIAFSDNDGSAFGFAGLPGLAWTTCLPNRRNLGIIFSAQARQCNVDDVDLQYCSLAAFGIGLWTGLRQSADVVDADPMAQLCADFSSYGYTDQDVGCSGGECGACEDRLTQNSHGYMLETFGPACTPL